MATDELLAPGTGGYDDATQPHNSSGTQRPAFVARPRTAADVAAVVRESARRGLTVVPQATGHGAGGKIGDDTVIVDTSGLDALTIDAQAGIATAGAGLTWGQVNAAAEGHGLLGLAGSSPTVSICGYTFGGGIGWLIRPHGMASSALRAVDYVDGRGELRRAADDAPDELDREALWAYRGGGGVGIATSLEFDLVAVPDLRAGYLLWSAKHLDAVVSAWAEGMSRIGDDVATSISVIHAPPGPPFPESLQGKSVVHLAVAAGNGTSGAAPLIAAVLAAAEPEVDTWSAAADEPATVKILSGIHLDPPVATPAIGVARWLSDDTPAVAGSLLSLVAPDDAPLTMLEIRNVGNAAPARDGAETTVPGGYVVHAVGALTSPDARPGIDAGLAAVVETARPADVGRSVGSWMEGATSVPDALPPDIRSRVAAVADRVDPDRALRRSRYLT